jgi:hypothetical protein
MHPVVGPVRVHAVRRVFAESPTRRVRLQRSDGFVSATAAPIPACRDGLSDPVAGCELHPLKIN